MPNDSLDDALRLGSDTAPKLPQTIKLSLSKPLATASCHMKVSMGSLSWEHRGEVEIVELARSGDLAAFDVLVARYRPGALVLARQIAETMEVADDAVQDSFLAVFKALPQLEDTEKFAGWFGAILRNRTRRICAGYRAAIVPLDDVILAHTPSICLEIERRAEAESIRCEMNRLSEVIRLPMELYYLEDWTVAQISAFLALPITTVKWRLHAGRKLLRASLSIQLEEPYESSK